MEESDGNMQSYSWADVEVAEVRRISHGNPEQVRGRATTIGKPCSAPRGPILPRGPASCQ